MATLQKTVEIIFGGKNEVSKVIGTIEKDLGRMATPLADMALSVVKLDAALAALAIGGLAYAYNKAVLFETAMVSFNKVSDGTPATLLAARDAAFALSTQYGISATAALNSSTDFLQAGFNTKESLMLTKTALDMSIAGEVSAAEASQFLVTTLKGFKAPAEDAARLTDILNEVSNKYATDVRQLAIGMADIAPIAKLMGFSFEETAGLLTPVIEVFGSGSESARGLKTGLLKLIDDAQPVQAFLETLRVKQTDANGALRSGKDILLDVQKAFVNLSDPQKIFLTQQGVGIDQAAKMLEVFNGLNKTTEVTAVALGAAGSAAKEVALRLESSQVQIDRFKEGITNLAIVVGEKFKTAATGAASGANDIVKSINSLVVSGQFDPLLDQVNKFAREIGDSLKETAKNLPEAFKLVDWSSLLNSLDEAREAIVALFGIDKTDPEELAQTIQTISDSLASLLDVTRGMGEVFAPIINTAKGAVEGFNTLDSSTKTLVGNLLGAGAAYKLFGPIAGTVMFLVGQDSETMATTVNTAFAAMENGINAIKVGVLSVAMVFATASQGMSELLDTVSFSKDEEAATRTADRVKIIGDLLEEANSKLVLSSDKAEKAFSGAGNAAKAAQISTEKYSAALGALPTDTKAAIEEIQNVVVEPLDLEIVPWADRAKVENVLGVIKKTFPDGQVIFTNVEVSADDVLLGKTVSQVETAVAKVKKATKEKQVIDVETKLRAETLKKESDTLQKWIKKNKGQVDLETKLRADSLKKESDTLQKYIKDNKATISLEAKLDANKLKEQSDIIQTTIQWKAKVDISQAEESTKKFAASIDSISKGIGSTSEQLSGLFGLLNKTGYGPTFTMIEDQIRLENKLRQQQFDLQKDLIGSQITLNDKKAKAIASGPSLIQVQAAGLQPHLEAILWEILKSIQVRANESGAEFLLGMTGST